MEYACSFLQTPVRDAMRGVISALTPDTSLAAAARMLAERHVTGAPVVDAAGRAVGVLSRTDLIAKSKQRSAREGHAGYYVMMHGDPQMFGTVGDVVRQPGPGVVGDVMTRTLITVAPDALLRDAIALMVRQEVHRVLVVESDKLVGVLTTMDVLRLLTPHPEVHDNSGY